MSLLFSTHTALTVPGATALLVTAWAAAAFDWLYWRIPNALLAGSAAAALMLALFAPNAFSLTQCALGGLAGLALLLPFDLAGGMGAGDVKLLSVLGMHAGWMHVIDIALVSALVGGLWSLALLILHWPGIAWLQAWTPWRRMTGPQMVQASRGTIPYGVVIAIGATVAMAAM